MADLRTVVLAMSPRAAEALERQLLSVPLAPNDAALLRRVSDEVNVQLHGFATGVDVTPALVSEDTEAQRIAQRMAQAASEAVRA
jgi:hypothetical protein